MGLVDAGARGLRWALVLPDVLLRRIPEARIVYGRDVELLCDASDPGGNALLAGMVVGGDERDLMVVLAFLGLVH